MFETQKGNKYIKIVSTLLPFAINQKGKNKDKGYRQKNIISFIKIKILK